MNLETSEKKELYTMEDILEMLQGYEYFEEHVIKFVYHRLNNNEEEALHYKGICLEHNINLKKKHDRLKSEEEIKALNNNFN